jgi:hypothetical protein
MSSTAEDKELNKILVLSGYTRRRKPLRNVWKIGRIKRVWEKKWKRSHHSALLASCVCGLHAEAIQLRFTPVDATSNAEASEGLPLQSSVCPRT